MQNKNQYLPPSVLSKVLIFLKFNTYWKLEIPLGPSPGSTTGWHCSHSTCQHLKRCDNSTVILHSEMSHTYTAWKIFPVSSQEQQWNFLYTKPASKSAELKGIFQNTTTSTQDISFKVYFVNDSNMIFFKLHPEYLPLQNTKPS